MFAGRQLSVWWPGWAAETGHLGEAAEAMLCLLVRSDPSLHPSLGNAIRAALRQGVWEAVGSGAEPEAEEEEEE